MDFYTNVQIRGSKILLRGINKNKRIKKEVDYRPTLFVPSKTETKYKTIQGEWMTPIHPGNIREVKNYISQYKDIANFSIWGNQRFEYTFIADKYPEDINWDVGLIQIDALDIEVDSETGFPEPDKAQEKITAITVCRNKKYYTFALKSTDSGKFEIDKLENINHLKESIIYHEYDNEFDLLENFINFWISEYPDIITGWNIKFFDIPYLINRITKIFGEDKARLLSPWNYFYKRAVNRGMGKIENAYVISGLAILDYLELYKKFARRGSSQESYKLDNIAFSELKKRKISYEQYGNLYNLYHTNYQIFIEYNIYDVELINLLEDKLKLLELAITLAYDSKCNYEDVFTQVRMWDAIIFNYLKKDNIVIPPSIPQHKDNAYVGAYVKDPKLGLHNWIVSYDLNSLYPHLIIQFNISPDQIIEPKHYTEKHKNILNQKIDVDSLLYQKINTTPLNELKNTITPNGQFFDISKQGFLSKIMEDMYNDRVQYKKKMIEAKKELEKTTDEKEKIYLQKKIARYSNFQESKKVCLNSAYGSMGNEYFRFYDVRQASAVTTSGQLVIRWIENKLNSYMNKILKTNNEDYCIASDTDSIYLSMDKLINETILKVTPEASKNDIIDFMNKISKEKIEPYIEKSYEELGKYLNVYAQKMIMKRESLADKGIWVAKKRYILNIHDSEGIRFKNPEKKIMGLEMIKSSTPTACRQKMKDAIDILFSGTEKDMIDFIANLKKEFINDEPKNIAFPRGIGELYKFAHETKIYDKGTPIHVRGALIYNNLIKTKKLISNYPPILEGEKIKFIYLKEPNPVHSNVISFSEVLPKELMLEEYIDYETQFQKGFIEPLKMILDVIGWKTEKVSSLKDFFT